MLTLFGPMLAQMVTAAVGDRTEVRAVIADTTHYEAMTRPVAALSFSDKQLGLALAYSPSFTLTPLESKPRDLLIFHNASLVGSYAWRTTTLAITQSVGVGEQNYRVLLTAGGNALPNSTPTTTPPNVPAGGTSSTPVPAGGTGAPGSTPSTPNGTPATQGLGLDQAFLFRSYTTSASLTHNYSRALSLGAQLLYTVSGAVHEADQANFPTVKGPTATVLATQRLDGSNTATGALSVQYAVASTGTETWISTASGLWTHRFDPHTTSQLGAGVSGARNSRSDGYVAYSIYPTFLAGITNVQRLSPGSLSFNVNASSAPALDFNTLIVDPRVGLNASAAWQRDQVFATLAGSTSYSISADHSQGAVSGATGGLGVGYQFGAAFSMDTGVRVAWQAFNGNTTVPFTYAAYLGATVGLGGRL